MVVIVTAHHPSIAQRVLDGHGQGGVMDGTFYDDVVFARTLPFAGG